MGESAANPALFAAAGDGGGGGGEDNLSISLGEFFAFLDGEPPPPQDAQQPAVSQDFLLQGMPGADVMRSQNVFQNHEVLKNEELWANYSHMDTSQCQTETRMEFNHAGQTSDHSKVASYAVLSNDYFENSRTGNFDSQHLPGDALNCSSAAEGANPPECEDFSSDFYFGDQPMYFEQMGVKLESNLDGIESEANMSRDSSYNRMAEQSGLSEVQCENTGAMLNSVGPEKNRFTSTSMFPVDHNGTVLGASCHGLDLGEATGSMYNGNSSCVTGQGEYGTLDIDCEGLPQQFSQNYEQCGMEQFPQNLDGSSSMQLGTPDDYCDDTSLSDCLVPAFDASSSESLSCEQSQSEDIYFRSESSTDSSPVPSSRNSTSEEADRYLADTSKQLPSSSINEHSRKEKQYDINRAGNSAIQRNPTRGCFSADGDDADLCILEGSSNPASGPLLPLQGKLQQNFQQSVYANPILPRFGRMAYKPLDERMTLRLALQDISQPKSETSPPDGFLTIPLLRHQKIALSWMVQKETSSLNCSGGILADDQGLGKTVSAISLILTERSPSSQPSAVKQEKYESLNLDDDEDDEAEHHPRKQLRICSPEVTSRTIKLENPVLEVKTRPAAGTLVVCPTSVLRQWAEELRNKVSSKANLSFLVYHGSNRAKDPYELTKYDVVLTTYAIVSMEVPKQSNPDDDEEEEKGKPDKYGVPVGTSGSKKRKSSSKKTKNGNPVENSLPERPLARVAWFRVILDEAQSIKNYRTQVARACWGLRAKRRWCLSGTPIQNAVEDLYSYFRFLRYDPYAVYKQFCSMIKVPISRNPVNGYKKLQVVLKTVMLRRTKATLLDGKPIICLPPKTVFLKKVYFTYNERGFYSILEAESREKFKVYAAAGTVKQNYVNILLMLLRLRQACDHPLLVKGGASSSSWTSSLQMAKKLTTQKQQELLGCLQSFSAICTLCSDAPEDAVVTICGHVFCNQCICEHLTGDDSICPASSCRVRLNSTSLFSRGTLECSLSGITCDFQSSDSCAEVVHAEKFPGINSSYKSSKVRAALEILLSLPKIDSAVKDDMKKSNDGVDAGPPRGPERIGGKSSSDSRESKVTEKAIVFSQWTRMLDLMEVHLKASHVNYRRLDGTMSVASRERAVKDFNTVPEVTVMIMSLKAASLGLNMVAACHVVLLDLWWNPTTEDQAIDRAHRIGQTRPVTVSRLTVADTVEDRILALQEKKREMVASAFGEDKSGSRQTRLTVEDLNYLFRV